ncbi:MAG: MHS family MFS transporter [Rhizobacter sp.]|nr:MHS family MFS transporter [Bacteriovorax sp.]
MATAERRGITKEERSVIFASSLGTVFEWYDFYLYGSLATIISKQFFSGVNETTAFIFALMAFAAGFAVRPFGAIFFGRIGDLVGRKYTFLVTIIIMGLSTAVVGMLPNYASIGVAAPIILIVMRLLQGLALGGEYGGAATYVAEHSPMGKRGLYTAWIQTTATIGLFISLIVILICRKLTGPNFDVWGWRIPFLLSLIMLAISVYIRTKLNESPVFLKMKAEGTTSKAPLKDAFGKWKNLKVVIFALFGATAGQAVVWYTGQFYALFFMTKILMVEDQAANLLIAAGLAIGTPFFLIFGALSDKIGRKKIILSGCLLAALTFIPLFKALTHYANPAIFEAQKNHPVHVIANQEECHFQFDPIGKTKFTSPCDIAKSTLAKKGVSYINDVAPAGTSTMVTIGSIGNVATFDGTQMAGDEFKAKSKEFDTELTAQLKAAGYPASADPSQINYPMVILILTILVIYVTMVYGPIAAYLVELFPSRIRYTSMSLPYHIGNGWFGGFLPTIAFAMVAMTGNIYYGLWYPIAIAIMTVIVGFFVLPETKDWDLDHHD